jgi:hypothetical protein
MRQRIHAGLQRALANGKTLGRPLNDPKAIDKARQGLAKGLGINKVARQVGLSSSTIARLRLKWLPRHRNAFGPNRAEDATQGATWTRHAVSLFSGRRANTFPWAGKTHSAKHRTCNQLSLGLPLLSGSQWLRES